MLLPQQMQTHKKLHLESGFMGRVRHFLFCNGAVASADLGGLHHLPPRAPEVLSPFHGGQPNRWRCPETEQPLPPPAGSRPTNAGPRTPWLQFKGRRVALPRKQSHVGQTEGRVGPRVGGSRLSTMVAGPVLPELSEFCQGSGDDGSDNTVMMSHSEEGSHRPTVCAVQTSPKRKSDPALCPCPLLSF